MIQLTLTLKTTTAQVVETSVTVNNNSPIQDYSHLDDQTQPTFEMTPGFKSFTIKFILYTYALFSYSSSALPSVLSSFSSTSFSFWMSSHVFPNSC